MGFAGIPAVVEEITPSGSVYYVREPNGELIARVTNIVVGGGTGGGTGSFDASYYHFDELGSTRMITNGAGVVTDTYAYDAYGNVIGRYGNTQQPYQYVGRYGYYTHYQAPGFGLLQLGVRFYDPETGRFTQRDPIKDGLNWYGYVEGQPIVKIDPTGLKSGCKDKCYQNAERLNDLANLSGYGATAVCAALSVAVGALSAIVGGVVTGIVCGCIVGSMRWLVGIKIYRYKWACIDKCDDNPNWGGPKLLRQKGHH